MPPRRLGPLLPPLLLSLAAHALVVAGLWFWPGPGPGAGRGASSLEVDAVRLQLDEEVFAPSPSEPEAGRAGEEQEFHVALVAAPAEPAPPSDAVGGPPVVRLPGDLSSGTGSPSRPGGGRPGRDGAGVGRLGLFPLPATARSVVYVLDRSISMGPDGALERARAEVCASLRALPPGTRFQIVAYNQHAEPLSTGGPAELLMADPAMLARAVAELSRLRPSGGSDHARALLRGLAFRPDVLFLVTDADELNRAEVLAVTRFNQGRTALHVVELSWRPQSALDGPLCELAALNRGTVRRVVLRP